MSFSLSTLLAGFVFGVVGIWLIRTGRREGNFRLPLIGLALIVYPYFSPNVWADWGIGAALSALAYFNFEA